MYYIQNIVSSIKFKRKHIFQTRYFHGNLPRNINIRSIRSAGTAEAIGIMGIRYKGFTSLGILNTWASGTLMGFHFF